MRAQLIRRWKPWESSTGPKSDEGKAKVSQNGYKGAERQLLREVRQELAKQLEITDLLSGDGASGLVLESGDSIGKQPV